jgi:parallel beta-helix repeat protein
MKTLQQIEPRTPISTPNFFITASGSYYLTQNITGLSGLHGITIQADNVTLDLNGFALIGVGSGTHGIFVSSGGKNLTIRNGTIRNWGGRGLRAGAATNSRFEHLRVSNSGAQGIEAGANCTVADCNVDTSVTNGILTAASGIVSGCTVTSSAGGINVGDNSRVEDCVVDAGTGSSSGITCAQNCAVVHCTAQNNPGKGIDGGSRGSVQGCVARGNTTEGIAMIFGLVKDCLVEENLGSGIVADAGCSIIDCVARDNGVVGIAVTNGQGTVIERCSATSNDSAGISLTSGGSITHCAAAYNNGDGIRVSVNCYVATNTCHSNGLGAYDGAGIHAMSGGNRIDGNTVTENDRGLDVDVGGNLIIRNSAQGNGANYSAIAAGNTTGEIVDTTGVGGTLNETHGPWANFSY